MMEIERDLRTSIPAKHYIYLLGINGTIRRNRISVAQASGSATPLSEGDSVESFGAISWEVHGQEWSFRVPAPK